MFFITCFSEISLNKLGYPDIGNTRTVGFVETLEEAGQLLMDNVYDLWETIYQYAVIEEIHPGIYPIPEDRCFFRFDTDTKRYIPIEEPDVLKSVALFAF